MSYIPLNDNIIFIQAESKGKYPYSNSLLINDEVKALIDTGIESNLAERTAKEYKINLVINSHSHEDHVAGTVTLRKVRFVPINWKLPL